MLKRYVGALLQTKNNTAVGPGGFTKTQLFRLIQVRGKILLHWNISMIYSIYKKCDGKELSNFRGIKLFRLLAERLEE